MLASLSWLGEFVEIGDLSPEEVADRLVTVGLEVEGLSDFKGYLMDVVAARVLEFESGPEPGGLARCLLDAGSRGRVQVMCGAPDIDPGGLYPLALPGCELPSGTVRSMTVRGSASDGMLCSEAELLVGEDSSGLMALDRGIAPGTPLGDLYGRGDWILEVGITPNRGDALSHLGIARDLGAILARPLKSRPCPVAEDGPPASEKIRVDIECPDEAFRYCGRVVYGARPAPSPVWLSSRLMSLGLRSINNIVDVTNYVMLELGLPLHAFDLGRIAGGRIAVRTFGPGTRFTTLDGQERVMKAEGNVLICDGERPVAIGGVMGGLNSEVAEDTEDVFIEGAMFNPVNVRRTSKSLGLSTDASFRFERGQDVNMCPRAVDRAASLISELTSGRVAPGLVDCCPRPWKPRFVPFTPARCNALLGTSHSEPEMDRALGDLGVRLQPSQTTICLYDAEIPSWRPDLTREADLFEEVMRILDFGSLPATLPKPPSVAQEPHAAYRTAERIRGFMAGKGYTELLSFSFLNANFADRLGLGADHPLRREIRMVANPLSEEQGALRTTIVPSLLNAARLNQYHEQRDLALFELSRVFRQKAPEGAPDEIPMAGALLAGDREATLWCEEKRPVDFFDLKGAVEALAASFTESWEFVRDGTVPPYLDVREAAAVRRGGELLGHLGLVKASVADAFGLKKSGGPVYVFELETSSLPPSVSPAFEPFPGFPPAVRDLAVLVDESVPAADLEKAFSGGDYPLRKVAVFDLYTGGRLPPGKKSIAFRLYFQDCARTLTEELVSGYFKLIAGTLEKEFGATLRS
ncbi:MAG: phenylalanine--tRNA ligase subunit beta [Deltaproteobacteria bacterium]|jgi:phenylalanyl-tRNA synthetase beta chain|nr:phenylalanine--tRNA ligase subunit beta [Deltaproteobacteria bacterium]